MVEHLAKEQIDDFKRLFDEMDRDKDGKLTYTELKEGCKVLHIDMTEEQMLEIIQVPGARGSASESDGITFPEFLISMSKENPDVDKIGEEVITAFRVFDHDGTGEISLVELKHVLMNMGQKYTEEEIEDMFSAAGISDMASINYTHFVQSSLQK